MTECWLLESGDNVGLQTNEFERLAARLQAGPARDLISRLADETAARELGALHLRRAIEEYSADLTDLDHDARETWLRRGQINWSDTTLAKHQRREASAFLADEIEQLEPMRRPISLIDFGAGDGQMTAAALEGLMQGGATVSNVQLIDQNTPALADASARFATSAPNLELLVTADDFRSFIPASPRQGTTIALASAAFHELGADERSIVLGRLSKGIRGLVIVELSQDNDGVNLASASDVARVARFYDHLIGDAYASVEPSSRWPVVGVFLLGEFLQILFNDYAGRGNYHLLTSHWAESLVASGFQVVAKRESRLGGLTTAYILAAAGAPGQGGELRSFGCKRKGSLPVRW